MLFFLLTPWIVFSLYMASPLPDVFRVRGSNAGRGHRAGEAIFV
jgi:hypothetical protein